MYPPVIGWSEKSRNEPNSASWHWFYPLNSGCTMKKAVEKMHKYELKCHWFYRIKTNPKVNLILKEHIIHLVFYRPVGRFALSRLPKVHKHLHKDLYSGAWQSCPLDRIVYAIYYRGAERTYNCLIAWTTLLACTDPISMALVYFTWSLQAQKIKVNQSHTIILLEVCLTSTLRASRACVAGYIFPHGQREPFRKGT